jgi:RTX calcium-binding nonapeptide repeat (4 copies)
MLATTITALALGVSLQGDCPGCASHANWPQIQNLSIDKPSTPKRRLIGTAVNDELLGGHGSNVISGRGGHDVLWGDFNPSGQPASQVDRIRGGPGNDFIYGSHGRNVIFGGTGNDKIRVHFGRGVVDCGPGLDIYHVARSRRDRYRFIDCERVDYRPESQGGVL